MTNGEKQRQFELIGRIKTRNKPLKPKKIIQNSSLSNLYTSFSIALFC